jgi:hypothetical protein
MIRELQETPVIWYLLAALFVVYAIGYAIVVIQVLFF